MRAPTALPGMFYAADGDALAATQTQKVILDKAANLTWKVTQLDGTVVRTAMNNEAHDVGPVTWVWDGMDTAGTPLPTASTGWSSRLTPRRAPTATRSRCGSCPSRSLQQVDRHGRHQDHLDRQHRGDADRVGEAQRQAARPGQYVSSPVSNRTGSSSSRAEQPPGCPDPGRHRPGAGTDTGLQHHPELTEVASRERPHPAPPSGPDSTRRRGRTGFHG